MIFSLLKKWWFIVGIIIIGITSIFDPILAFMIYAVIPILFFTLWGAVGLFLKYKAYIYKDDS